jgi:hypothetical protein
MPLSPAGLAQVPNFWNIFGHSYFQYTFGTRQQNGRADAVFRNLLNVDHTSFANFAVNGSRLTTSGMDRGSWAKVLNNVTGVPANTGDGAPYVASGGSYLLGWGINDLGFNGNTAQFNSAYALAMQAVISRCRASTFRPNTSGTIAYGAGFTSLGGQTGDHASGTTLRQCTVTGGTATFTITLPADYNGEPIAICYVAQAGVLGGTVTYTGTAGVTGSISTSNIQPAAAASFSLLISRITNLTSAAAGLTIIGTVSAIDAGGTVFFDSYWLEADNPPPVLVCNTARLLTAGYTTAGYFGGMGDSDVATFNAVLGPVIAGFDGMVQVVDIDSALNKDTTLFSSDGLHPNELGAAKISDAILAAVRRLPANRWGVAAAIQPPSPRTAALVIPFQTTQWYTSQSLAGATGTYTAVAGDQFAIPFEITSGVSRFTKWAVELTASTVATSVFAGIFEDRKYRGYPQQLHFTLQNAVAQTLATGAGVQQFTPAANFVPDPGLYWLVLKIVTAGTTTFRAVKGPSLFMPNLLATGGGGATTPSGWLLAGQGAGVMPATFVPGGVLADNCPMIGLLGG